MTMRVKGPDGRVYEFGPELWGELNLPGDHSAWARSVRWSCGRPGFTCFAGGIRVFDDAEVWDRAVWEVRAAERAAVAASVAYLSPDASIRVTAT